MTDAERKTEFEWATYQRWAIGPLMTREQWEARQTRIHSGKPLSPNPYEW